MRSKFLLLHLFLLLTVTTCSDDDPEAREQAAQQGPGQQEPPCSTSADSVTWESGISSIFKSKCASCHPGSQTTDYASYSGVKGNITVEKQKIDNDTMPPGGGVSQSDKDLIDTWIAAGMPEKTICLSGRPHH